MSISDSNLRDEIMAAGSEFDSHDIIHAIIHKHQRSYVDALAATSGDVPFKSFHSSLGKRIASICEELGYFGIASSSLDIFGQQSGCIRWTKQNP